MANVIYDGFKKYQLVSNIDWDADTFKVMLVTSSYTPSQTAHEFKSDITNEVTGTGYTAGGATLASITVTKDTTNHKGVVDAADITWSSSTITARGVVIYKDTGTASTSPIVCYLDLGADKSSSASNFTLQWDSNGILTIS